MVNLEKLATQGTQDEEIYKFDNTHDHRGMNFIGRRKTKQKHNTICVGHHYPQANKNNINKT